MCLFRIAFVSAAMVFLSVGSAQANVIYNWQSTSPGPYVTATGGELVVTDAAYRSGSIDFHIKDSDSSYPGGTSPGVIYENGRITNSPVVSADLNFDFTNQGDYVPDVFVTPGGRQFTEFGLPFVSQIAFNEDGTLTGNLFLYGNDASEEVNASGTRRDWSIFDYGSDYFASEQCGPPTCNGGSGYWQLSSISADVPAPPAWPLFVLAVAGVFGVNAARRCRLTSSTPVSV